MIEAAYGIKLVEKVEEIQVVEVVGVMEEVVEAPETAQNAIAGGYVNAYEENKTGHGG